MLLTEASVELSDHESHMVEAMELKSEKATAENLQTTATRMQKKSRHTFQRWPTSQLQEPLPCWCLCRISQYVCGGSLR